MSHSVQLFAATSGPIVSSPVATVNDNYRSGKNQDVHIEDTIFATGFSPASVEFVQIWVYAPDGTRHELYEDGALVKLTETSPIYVFRGCFQIVVSKVDGSDSIGCWLRKAGPE